MKRQVSPQVATGLLLILFLSFPGKVFAQKSHDHKSKTIEFDFARKSIPEFHFHHISKGDYYKIIITGINQNLFRIDLSVKDTTSGKPLETPVFANFNLEALSGLATGIAPLSTSGFQIKIEETKQDIGGKMSSYCDNLSQYYKRAVNLYESIDSVKLEVFKIRLNALMLDNHKNMVPYEGILAELVKISDKISKLKSDIVCMKEGYYKYSLINKDEIAKDKNLRSNDTLIKERADKLIKEVTDARLAVSADKINELLMPLVLIENNKGNTYTSMPFQFMGDEAKVRISIVPRDNKLNLQSYTTQIIFPVRKTYTHIGLSYYLTSLHDDPYSVADSVVNDTVTYYRVTKESSSNLEMGLTALLRYGIKFGEDDVVGFHGTLGAGISLADKIKPRFFAGAGFSFGIKHMLAVDIGAIMGYADRLSDAVDLSEPYTSDPGTVTVSKPAFGFFGAVGYIYHF